MKFIKILILNKKKETILDLKSFSQSFRLNLKKEPGDPSRSDKYCFRYRYNPPAHDILCFLQFTTTRQLREKHSKELFKIYHESMAEALEEAGLDISIVFPWDEFLESIEDLRVMCIVHGVLNIPIMLLESAAVNKYFLNEPELLENILYVDRTPLLCEQMKRVPQYRDRITDTLLELYDHVAG